MSNEMVLLSKSEFDALMKKKKEQEGKEAVEINSQNINQHSEQNSNNHNQGKCQVSPQQEQHQPVEENDLDAESQTCEQQAPSSDRTWISRSAHTQPTAPSSGSHLSKAAEYNSDAITCDSDVDDYDDDSFSNGDDPRAEGLFQRSVIIQNFNQQELLFIRPILTITERYPEILDWGLTSGEIITLGRPVPGSNIMVLLQNSLHGEGDPAGRKEFYNALQQIKLPPKFIKDGRNKALLRMLIDESNQKYEKVPKMGAKTEKECASVETANAERSKTVNNHKVLWSVSDPTKYWMLW